MKIHKVELEGFGPYRGREVVDLDAFEADGIFLITGRTGAGKSSVLDAITFALFGRLPRYDGLAGERVRSDHITPVDVCEVSVEFSVPSGRHRVTRRPAHERPKKRGQGTTTEKATFSLEVSIEGEWQVLEGKEGNAERFVSDVLPLSPEEFQQVILLAQGEFQKFLVAGSDERRVLLSKLFDTGRFTAYATDLQERARELRRGLDEVETQLATQMEGLLDQTGVDRPGTVDLTTGVGVLEWLDELTSAQDVALTEVLGRQAEMEAQYTRTQAALRDGRLLTERQERLARARARDVQLTSAAPDVDAVRKVIGAARRAAQAWPAVQSLASAVADERASRAGVVAAESAHEETVGRAAPSGRRAIRTVEELSTQLGALEAAQLAETTLRALDIARTQAQLAVDRHQERVTLLRDERWKAQDEATALDDRLTDLAEVLTQTADAQANLDRASAGLGAARARADRSERHTEALREQAEAAERQDEVTRRRTELLRRQYAEYAGVLAHDLTDGTGCPVCGSTEHPAKAERAAEHVSSDQVEQAHLDVQEAEKQLREAASAVAKVEALVAESAAASGGRSVEEWQEDVAAAEGAVGRRAEATRERRLLLERQPRLAGRIRELATTLEDSQEEATLLAKRQTLAEQEWRTASERIDVARGDCATVAERVSGLLGERAALVDVVEARAQLAQADEALTRAHEFLRECLAEQGFVSADQVLAARLDPADLADKEKFVAAHDAEVVAVTRTLEAPELQGLSEVPVDVAELESAERAGARTHAALINEASEVRIRHLQTRAAAGRIRAALARSTRVRDEFVLVNSLAETLRGQGQNERKIMLESFALAAELEEIVAAANGRLRRMTDGRYEFRHSDARAARGAQSGLSLDVLDAHTGEARSPRSLSGGEKFQASLALALGLAEVVTARAGGLRLDTLFIDEGFGSLDPETLESTMATLDSLREGGRTIGLISHVATLKESVPAQLHVQVTPGGWSTLAQRTHGESC